MPPRQKVIILKRNLMGDLMDDDGNRYNEAFQRIDYLGRVIPEPEEEPTTSSLSNGGAGAFQPQTLADYNRPDLFYPRRAAIQVDMDCLDEEPPKQDFQFQNRGVQSRGWYDAPFQVQEAPVHQDSKYGEFDFDAWQKKLDAIFYPTRNTEESSELVSVDMDLCVDRRKVFPSQVSSVGVSVDTVLCVDQHDPLQHQTGVFKSSDATKPPPEPPEYVPEPPEPLPDPKPPEHYDTDVCEVLSHGDTYELTVMPEEAATPGSCHKRKSPATTLQPPLKRMRTHIGAVVVHPAAAYIIDPGDTYVVYSRGPRPPPPEQWYVLSNPPSSSAGRRSYPPRRSHPNAAYLPDPEETDVVYHMGPRPP